ncbi:MAG TPA: diguanylate cyclase, partial [Dehalococcoidia bacterium]|nr:diguanylate cyclase [Dehalococcoidia bacterium]
MTGYIIRRLIAVPFMLLGISFVLFMLLYIRPGSAAFAVVASIMSGGDEATSKFEEKYGLNDPWYEQYTDWLWGVISEGSFGDALTPPNDSVTEKIFERLPNT